MVSCVGNGLIGMRDEGTGLSDFALVTLWKSNSRQRCRHNMFKFHFAHRWKSRCPVDMTIDSMKHRKQVDIECGCTSNAKEAEKRDDGAILGTELPATFTVGAILRDTGGASSNGSRQPTGGRFVLK